MLKNKEPQSDYEHLTEEEWADTVRRHVDQLDRVVTEAMRTAFTAGGSLTRSDGGSFADFG